MSGNKPLRAIILAAGIGSRLQPLTINTPKPLVKIGKYRLIEHQILKLVQAGFHQIIINLHHLGTQIEKLLGTGSKYGVEITYSKEEKLLGTAGGIAKALTFFGGNPFAVINADVLSDFDFGFLARIIQTQKPNYVNTLVLVDNPTEHPQGDFYYDENQNLIMNNQNRSNQSNSTNNLLRKTYSGFAVFNPQIFSHIKPNQTFELKPILSNLANQELLYGHYHAGKFFDCGDFNRLYIAQKWFANQYK